MSSRQENPRYLPPCSDRTVSSSKLYSFTASRAGQRGVQCLLIEVNEKISIRCIQLMSKYLCLFVLCLAPCFDLCSIYAQTPSKPAPSKPDYSKEPIVIEQDSTKVVFENDGTSTRQSAARIRIQSDAGLQRYGVLTFPYQNSTESVDIAYVRVIRSDGAVVSTPADNVQDMPAEITRAAPFYSDLREKHVAVKGLGWETFSSSVVTGTAQNRWPLASSGMRSTSLTTPLF